MTDEHEPAEVFVFGNENPFLVFRLNGLGLAWSYQKSRILALE